MPERNQAIRLTGFLSSLFYVSLSPHNNSFFFSADCFSSFSPVSDPTARNSCSLHFVNSIRPTFIFTLFFSHNSLSHNLTRSPDFLCSLLSCCSLFQSKNTRGEEERKKIMVAFFLAQNTPHQHRPLSLLVITLLVLPLL